MDGVEQHLKKQMTGIKDKDYTDYENTDDTEEKVSLSYTVSDTGLHCVIILLVSQRYTV